MTNRQPGDRRTMKHVSHTHPYTSRGAINNPFMRGPVVAADGGRREDTPEKQVMRDVEHTPPNGKGAERVFERGAEFPEDGEADPEDTEGPETAPVDSEDV